MKKKNNFKDILLVLPMYIFTIAFIIGPLIYMVLLSFLKRGESWGFVFEFTTGNYKNILEPIYLKAFLLSFKLALTSTFFIILLGYPFGYFMAKLSSKWKSNITTLIMIPFWTSALIRMYGWIIIFRANGVLDKFLMNIGVIEKPLKLLYTYPAVVVGMVYALLPFMIFSVYSSAEKLDWSLLEAARDLGANALQTFFTITLKLTLPGLLSGVILTFIPSMGLFFIADILGGNKFLLIGNIIQEQLLRGNNWPFAAALAVILTLFTSLMIFLYRKITKVKDLEGLM